MQCTSPKYAWPDESGRYVFHQDSRRELGAEVVVPCNQCIACRLRHAQTWTSRCEAELRQHSASCFTTLTYRPELRPLTRDAWRRDGRLYLMRMQEHFGPGQRYFGVLERGDMGGAPHFHFIEFGHDYREVDGEPIGKSKGHVIYRSALLERLWPHGHVLIGAVTPESIGYVARYTTKKLSGASARGVVIDGQRFWSDKDGVLSPLPQAEVFCSRRPAIGSYFADTFGSDLIGGLRGHGGKRLPTPRSWLRRIKANDPALFEQIQSAAQLSIKRNLAEESPERCAVRAEVLEARLSLKGARR